MTPKEKAIEIYQRNSNILSKYIFNGYHDIAIELSINEIKEIERVCPFFDSKKRVTEDQYLAFEFQFVSYWQEVKQEIEKL